MRKRIYQRMALNSLAILVTFFMQVLPVLALIKIEYSCEDKKGSSCLRNGGLKSIYIYDEITQEDASELASIDNMMPIEMHFPKVYINSYGGFVSAAQRIGRILRRRNASIEGRDLFFPSKAALCSSSCVFIAAGAVDRQLDHIGVHRPFYERTDKFCKTEQIPVAENIVEEDLEYFKEMGITEKLFDHMRKTDFQKMTEFFYDPDTPYEEQLIVQFGFHMHKNSDVRPAMFNKDGKINDSNPVEALEQAVSAGDVRAAIQLAKIYDLLRKEDPKYTNKAIQWYTKAGDMGDVNSYHYLGVMFSNGYGTKKDPAKANYFYMKAAALGHAGSQNNLGWSYYKGNGVKKDLGLAIYWLTRSADQGEPFAYGSIGEMTYYGHGFPFDKIEAVKWLTLADEHMPEGETRDLNHALLKKLKKKMSEGQFMEGTNLARSWRPLKQSDNLMGEKCKID